MFHPEDEIITEKTSYIDEDGNVAPMTEEKALYFRTYEAEKVPAGEELEKCVLPEDDLILLAMDPCRPGVKDSVQLRQNAGVKVTGDNVQTARAIALECGILTSDVDASEPTLIEGKSFRAMTDAERDKISDKISVMGRLSPNDKLLLVQSLRRQGHVVAVTGDGTNDAPALHEADIGLAMGIAGTEVAKESSDIIILDDNFASVVKAGGEVHEYGSQRYEISTCRHQVLTKLDYSGTTSSLSSPNWWFCIVFVLLVGFALKGFALKGVLWLRNKFRSEPVDESEPVEESEPVDEPEPVDERNEDGDNGRQTTSVVLQKLVSTSIVDEDEKPGNAEDPGNETVADASKPAEDGANELAISSKMTIPHRRDGVVFMGILGTYRLVAAVLLNPSLSSEDEIENERKLLCESDTHANIIRYYGLKKVDNFSYLCLERWVCCLDDLTHFAKKKLQEEPDSLDEIIDGQLWTEIGIPTPLMIQLMRNVVSAVNHLHSKQIIHRNLTPENVLICKEGKKIVAKLSGLGKSAEIGFTSKNFGDANWQAPEQLKNSKESDSTDLFQLGCILFYAFTGHHPYGDEKVRGKNIRQSSRVKVITSLLKNCEAACLIANLLERNQGSCSITASDAVQHPLFWDSDRRRNFLRDSVEYIKNLDASAQVIKDLYARVGWKYAGWNKLLDADLVSRMVAMGGNYNYDYVKDLLRFIRNVISHYGEFPSEIQAIVSDGVEQYFALKFESLLMDVYTAISKNCKGNATFRAYFLP